MARTISTPITTLTKPDVALLIAEFRPQGPTGCYVNQNTTESSDKNEKHNLEVTVVKNVCMRETRPEREREREREREGERELRQ